MKLFSKKNHKNRRNLRNKSNNKGQSSVEYIFMVAMALALIIPGTIIFQQYTVGSQKAIVSSQIYKIGNDLVDSAELMYSVGENSWQTLEINFPKEIQSVTIFNQPQGSEVVLRHGTDYTSDAVFFTKNKFLVAEQTDCSNGCSLDINPGFTKIRIESQRGGTILFRKMN